MSPRDYRKYSYNSNRIILNGQFLANSSYSKLYVIENTFRIMLNSILTVTVGGNWWALEATDQRIRSNVGMVRANEAAYPRHTSPGQHDIYCIFLTDIIRITRRQANNLRQVIPDIDRWVILLEKIRTPRNLVGHMNWIHANDRKLIRQAYFRSKNLMPQISAANIAILVPS